MHPVIIPIDAPAISRVEHIFNSYLYQVRSLEHVVASPRSMAAYAALVAAEEATTTQNVAEMDGMLRGLQVLSNSLHELAHCLTEAYLELEEFITEGSDFQQFAAYKRVQDLEQYGYADEADVTPDGRAFCLRSEPEALAPFQLPVVLAEYFATTNTQGERIGTSGPADYAYYSSLVANELVFALRDPSQPATPANLTTYRRTEVQEAGFTEVEQPDERFVFASALRRGPALVAQFNTVLTRCQKAATLYHSLAADDAAGYARLFALLTKIVDQE